MQNQPEFIGIIKDNEGLIYKITKVYTNTREDGEDLYQEIVYQLWKSFPSFRNDSKVSTWMYRIALNTAITYSKKEKRKGHLLPVPETLHNKADTKDTLTQERIERLYDQIRKLNPVEKGIILLYLEGKNYEEMAALTGFTATNIGTRLGRIKQKLSSQINQ